MRDQEGQTLRQPSLSICDSESLLIPNLNRFCVSCILVCNHILPTSASDSYPQDSPEDKQLPHCGQSHLPGKVRTLLNHACLPVQDLLAETDNNVRDNLLASWSEKKMGAQAKQEGSHSGRQASNLSARKWAKQKLSRSSTKLALLILNRVSAGG